MAAEVQLRGTVPPHDPLYDELEAAAYLKAAPRTLAVWRCTGRYDLPFVKVGRSVRYRKSDLDLCSAFIRAVYFSACPYRAITHPHSSSQWNIHDVSLPGPIGRVRAPPPPIDVGIRTSGLP